MNTMPKISQKRKNRGFDLETANFIVAMFKTDYFSVADVCRTAGIGRTTFYKWIKTRPEFLAAIENAKRDLRERMDSKIYARNSLMRRLKGFTITERKVITRPSDETDSDGNPIPMVKAIVERTREIPPDTEAIIFVLTNADPKHWKRANRIEIVKPMHDDEFARLSDDELELVIERLSARLDESKKMRFD